MSCLSLDLSYAGTALFVSFCTTRTRHSFCSSQSSGATPPSVSALAVQQETHTSLSLSLSLSVMSILYNVCVEGRLARSSWKITPRPFNRRYSSLSLSPSLPPLSLSLSLIQSACLSSLSPLITPEAMLKTIFYASTCLVCRWTFLMQALDSLFHSVR